MVIIIVISGIFIINNTSSKLPNNQAKYIAKNYEVEYLAIITNNLTQENIDNFNHNFKKFINSSNYDSEICSISETEEDIYISNYMGKNCNLTINGDFNQIVYDNDTIVIDRFINNTNIYLCSCSYVSGKNSYYINIYNDDSKTILKN